MPKPKHYSGKLADPEFRRTRAVTAAKARTTLDAHVKAVVDRAPELSPDQLTRLSALLRGSGDAA